MIAPGTPLASAVRLRMHGMIRAQAMAEVQGGAGHHARRCDQEATFGGYTIPARLRVGWHFDDPSRFDADGKFFEVSIDDASYRERALQQPCCLENRYACNGPHRPRKFAAAQRCGYSQAPRRSGARSGARLWCVPDGLARR
jgi:hypothetical protein